MAAFGAGFFASGIVTILVSLLFRLTTRETPLPSPFELGGLAGTAAALAVAWVGGGRSTVAGYFGVLVLERLLGLPGQLRFCGQSLFWRSQSPGVSPLDIRSFAALRERGGRSRSSCW